MKKSMNQGIARSIDEYIASQDETMQGLLKQMRETIRKAAPEAKEAIKYAMPTFTLGGNLVHFAACKNHIGFYPTPSAITAFTKEIAKYESSKGAVQFPLTKKLPLRLIRDMVKFRVQEVKHKQASKKKAN